MKKFKQYWIVFLLMIIGTACTQTVYSPTYYTLEYQPAIKNPEDFGLNGPIPVKIQVLNAKLPRTYDRTHIIVRYSAHQINYYRYHLWAVRPSYAIADLLNYHLNRYNLFKACMREYLDEKPDYELIPIVDQIELFANENYNAAHLAMTYYLRKTESQEYVLRFGFDREVELPSDFDMSNYAQNISYVMRDQTNLFIQRLVDYFKQMENNANASSETTAP